MTMGRHLYVSQTQQKTNVNRITLVITWKKSEGRISHKAESTTQLSSMSSEVNMKISLRCHIVMKSLSCTFQISDDFSGSKL